MADKPISLQKLVNADKDADTLEQVTSADKYTTIVSRLGRQYPSLAKALQTIIDAGGFKPYSTEAELKASVPVIVPSAAYAFDTKKVWLWNGSAWVDEGTSALDQAKSYADSNPLFKPVNITSAIDFHDSARATGTYYVVSTSAFNSSTNKPPVVSTVKHGFLNVNKFDANNYAITYYAYDDAAFYVDYFKQGVWQGWRTFKSYDQVETYVQNYVRDSVKIPVLSAGIDFLGATESKKYYISSNASFALCTNTPPISSSTKHGLLEQHVLADDSIEIVTYFSTGDNCIYFNKISSGVWAGWSSFRDINYVSSLIDASLLPKSLTSAIDFHNFTSSQTKLMGSSAFFNTSTNAPPVINSLKHGVLTVNYISSTNYSVHYFSFGDLCTYVDYNRNGVWQGWRTFKSVEDSSEIICSYGKTLQRLKAKIGFVLANTGKLKIALGGDSWTEQRPITQAFQNLLYAKYNKLGDGWISVFPNWHIGNSIVNTNFTLYDASTTTTASPYLTGIDGNCIYTSGTNATSVISNITGTNITIYYYDGNGTFNYSLDGGPSVAVVGNGTNTFAKVVLSGLSDTLHNININTIGNTGAVAILGLYATKPSQNGVEVFRVGNGGLRSKTMQNYYANVGYFAADIGIDMYINILGTNDIMNADSVKSVYKSTLTQLVANYRSAVSNMSFALCSPATSYRPDAVNSLKDYDDAVRELSRELNTEFYSMYSSFGSHSQEKALGMWQSDDIHPTDEFGYRFAQDFINRLLRI